MRVFQYFSPRKTNFTQDFSSESCSDMGSWAPNDDGAFVGSWFAIFFLAVLFRTLLFARSRFETVWAAHWYGRRADASQSYGSSIRKPSASEEEIPIRRANTSAITSPPFRMQVEIPRTLLVFVTVILGYALMLITMTFVVVSLLNLVARSCILTVQGYFFAVCTGYAIGELAFGRYAHETSNAESMGPSACCV